MEHTIAMNSWYLPVITLILISYYLIKIFNRLVQLENENKNAFTQISVQLKRRHDLIPNLVEIAKTYLKHESNTLESVIAARNHADATRRKADRSPTPQTVGDLMGAENILTGALGSLFAVVENYPDLKADLTMGRLHEELVSTENRVAFARQAFNDAVMVYNTRCESFPDAIIAHLGGFKKAVLWNDISQEEREAVTISFDR
ncbi:MAG: LemA family protein [Magnetococcales bacterium]|nr:LemA family protein [Magnetococcales bacterium]